MDLAQNRVKDNRIVIGSDPSRPEYDFHNADMYSISSVNDLDMVGAELAVDELTPKVNYDINGGELWSPSDYDGILSSDRLLYATNKVLPDIRELKYGTPVWYYYDGNVIGKYYVKNVKRVAIDAYQINAISAIGIIDRQQHDGGVYTGETFQSVVSGIIGGAFSFTCSAEAAKLQVFGWLPIASKRKNLHQLCFSLGVAIKKDANGDMFFTYLPESGAKTIEKTRTFYGGDVDLTAPATAARITEHAFYILDTDAEVTLFDNTDGSGYADGLRVTFREAPCHDLEASDNLQILSSGVNHAIVRGTGTLKGKKYTHTTHDITVGDINALAENTVTVTDATLVNALNSQTVANKILMYYSSRKTVETDIITDTGLYAGDLLRMTDPYMEEISGYISRMSIDVSSFRRAKCRIITDYLPVYHGNAYGKSNLYTGSGVLTVPSGGAKITLIGGGNGGQSGGDGADGDYTYGSQGTRPTIGSGGAGGEPGKGGDGGKIFTIIVPAGTYTYSCGKGGAGGVSKGVDPTYGASGGATELFSDGALLYSSESGMSNSNGFYDMVNRVVYAAPGASDGAKGGKGGKPSYFSKGYEAEDVTWRGQTWYGGENIEEPFENGDALEYAGGGGGAAAGENGTSAVNSFGAKGGDAMNREDATIYGNGGPGGHGGGGGGVGGTERWTDYEGKTQWSGRNGGRGGKGGNGGSGSNGCIILYT